MGPYKEKEENSGKNAECDQTELKKVILNKFI